MKKRALIIDGNNYYTIAYYAAEKKGFGEAVASGFFERIAYSYETREQEHEFLFVVWDTKVNKRKGEDKEYKANRKPKPEGFYDMMPYIKDTLSMRMVEQYEKEGYEGDDIMLELSELCRKKGYQVTIGTSDHDLYQLLSGDDVIIYDPRQRKVITEKSFKDEFEIEPNQWNCVKAMMGDTSDNITGVKGIGKKWAFEIIKRFGSLEALYKSDMAGLPKGVKNNLTKVDGDYNAKESAFSSYELLKLRRLEIDAPKNAGILPMKVNPSIYIDMTEE